MSDIHLNVSRFVTSIILLCSISGTKLLLASPTLVEFDSEMECLVNQNEGKTFSGFLKVEMLWEKEGTVTGES